MIRISSKGSSSAKVWRCRAVGRYASSRKVHFCDFVVRIECELAILGLQGVNVHGTI